MTQYYLPPAQLIKHGNTPGLIGQYDFPEDQKNGFQGPRLVAILDTNPGERVRNGSFLRAVPLIPTNLSYDQVNPFVSIDGTPFMAVPDAMTTINSRRVDFTGQVLCPEDLQAVQRSVSSLFADTRPFDPRRFTHAMAGKILSVAKPGLTEPQLYAVVSGHGSASRVLAIPIDPENGFEDDLRIRSFNARGLEGTAVVSSLDRADARLLADAVVRDLALPPPSTEGMAQTMKQPADCQPGEVWWCDPSYLGDPSTELIKNRPVLVLARAPASPATRLVPLVHIVPLIRKIKDGPFNHTLNIRGRPTQARAANITTVPLSLLNEFKCRISRRDYFTIIGMVQRVMGLHETTKLAIQQPVHQKGDICPLLGEGRKFDGHCGMAVVAGRTTFRNTTNLHMMPLTMDPDNHALTAPVGNRSYGIDTAQIMGILPSSVGAAISRLDDAGITRLNQTIASQLNLQSG